DYLIVPESHPGNGKFPVDPRFNQSARWKDGQAYGVRRWDESTGAVTGQQSPGQGAFSVADPRSAKAFAGKYVVTPYDQATGTIISGSTTGQGAYAVADPRPGLRRGKGSNYLTAGHYGVVPWTASCGAVSAAAGHDNGSWSVADPRHSPARTLIEGEYLPAARERLV
ncbi:DNA cytosine methyltransferase, partial [Halomonas sp. THAF12]